MIRTILKSFFTPITEQSNLKFFTIIFQSIKSIQPLLNIAMASKEVFDKVLSIYKLYAAGNLKGQKPKQKVFNLII